METNCPVFHPQLTNENTEAIERVQKIVTRIILSYRYENYEDACSYLELDTLFMRREELCQNFALKCLKNEKHKSLFRLSESTNQSLRTNEVFEVPFARNERYL